MKKNIAFLLIILTSWTISAQIGIEKTTYDGSSILDFKSGTTNGIILPAVSTIPAAGADENGTFALFKSTGVVYMVQNDIWVPLTIANADISGLAAKLISNTSAELGGGVIIGAPTSPAIGVLVLESENLALTLPKVNNPAANVKSPYPGMICYDTASNTLAVFDGQFWNFWK